MIKLIAIDMDGTLLDDDKKISSANKIAIQSCIDLGIMIVISTGRTFIFAEKYLDELNLNNYLVTANGGQILNPEKEVISHHYLSTKQLYTLIHLCEEKNLNYWALTPETIFRNQLPDHYMDESWLKFGIMLDTEENARKLRKHLEETKQFEVTNTSTTNIEVNPLGVNKLNGVDFVCKETGVKMNEVMAIGDALNDIKLIEKAGFGIAMGNAQKPVKEVADFVTKDNNNDGAGFVINQFILNEYIV